MSQNSPSTVAGGSDTVGNPLSHLASVRHSVEDSENNAHDSMASTSSRRHTQSTDDISIYFAEEYRRLFNGDNGDSSDSDEDNGTDETMEAVEDDDMENSIPKYLIFSTGSKTYTPHQIGIKRVRHVTFPKKLDLGPSLKERVAARKERVCTDIFIYFQSI